MRIALYNPHLGTLGGGELLSAMIARGLTRNPSHQLDIITHDALPDPLGALEERFGIRLSSTRVLVVPRVPPGTNPLARLAKLFQQGLALSMMSRRYDLFITCAVAGLVLPQSRASLYVSMFPLPPHDGSLRFLRHFYYRASLRAHRRVVSISAFSAKWMKAYWGRSTRLLTPGFVFKRNAEALPRRNQILSIGRFFPGRHNKNHRVMIEAFASLCDAGLKGWELVLIGGLTKTPETLPHVEVLQAQAQGYPIRFCFDANAQAVHEELQASKIYWHAAGFGQREDDAPEAFEHFGISTLEAMHAGLVPIVHGSGGQKEIVVDAASGFHWQNVESLLQRTLELIENDERLGRMSRAAHERSLDFNERRFEERLNACMNDLVCLND